MALHEDILATQPLLMRAFLDERRLAPKLGHESTVNMALQDMALLKAAFFKAKAVEPLETIAARIVRYYVTARRHSEGHFMDNLARLANDGCEHVVLFAHDHDDAVFQVDYRARTAYRCRCNFRPPVPPSYRPRRAGSV